MLAGILTVFLMIRIFFEDGIEIFRGRILVFILINLGCLFFVFYKVNLVYC